jgi:hypothetical protein
MLRQEENEYLCHIGPGTPMGNLFPLLATGGAVE